MAGGLFGKPFALNEKCIIFSMIVIALFLYKPPDEIYDNKVKLGFMLFTIFIVSYVAMAWYDFYFDCRILPLKKGKYSVSDFFKPDVKYKKQISHKESDIDRKRKNIIIFLSHIIFIAPLLLYIAHKKELDDKLQTVVSVLAVFTLFYHGIQLLYNIH